MAVPLASARLTVVAVDDGLVRLTVNTAKPPASATLWLDTAIVGALSLSVIEVVTLLLTPLMTRFSKLPPVAVATVTVNDSAATSSIRSSIVAMLNVALELPAAIVTEATPV